MPKKETDRRTKSDQDREKDKRAKFNRNKQKDQRNKYDQKDKRTKSDWDNMAKLDVAKSDWGMGNDEKVRIPKHSNSKKHFLPIPTETIQWIPLGR